MATKFEELCRIYGELKTKFEQYEVEAGQLVVALRDTLAATIEAPSEHVTLFATHGTMAGHKLPGPTGALQLLDDTWFHVGFCIDLYRKVEEYPYERAGFKLRLKHLNDHYRIEILDDESVHEARTQEDLQTLADHMYDLLVDRYRHALHRFVVEGKAEARFGF